MKTTFMFYSEVLRTPWYRALPLPIRMFYTHLQADSDNAGWWFPDWDVAQAWLKLPTPLEPAEVEALLVAAGQVKVHPSGWWELLEYQAQQFPRGLSPSQPFHRSVKRLQDQHEARERALALKSAVAGAAPQAGLEPDKPQELGGGSASEPESHGSSTVTPSMGDACKTQAQALTPGPKAQDPGQGPRPSAPTGGPGGDEAEPLTYEGEARVLAEGYLLTQLRGMGFEDVTEPLKNALGALLDAHGLSGASEALRTYSRAIKRRSSHSLLLWLQDRKDACDHPDTPERRRWWTAKLGDGRRQKHWRCLVCGHHEPYGEPLPPDPPAASDEGPEAEGVAA